MLMAKKPRERPFRVLARVRIVAAEIEELI